MGGDPQAYAGVTSITLGWTTEAHEEPLVAAAIAAIGVMAPHLAMFNDSSSGTTAQLAGVITRAMPNMRSLRLVGFALSSVAEGAACACWEALPCSRLRCLVLTASELVSGTTVTVPRRVWEGAHWPQLRQLCGIYLLGDAAAALARGLPSLECLGAIPQGEWTGAGKAVFARVRQANLECCCESFTAHAHISSLLPSLERLTLWEECSITDCSAMSTDLAGATRLTHLVLGTNDGECFSKLQPRAWAALSTMSRLRHLALDMTFDEVPQVARLPPALELLSLNVAQCYFEEHGHVAWMHHTSGSAIDLCTVLEAAAGLPRLRSLTVKAPGMTHLNHGSLARLVHAGLGGLEALVMNGARQWLKPHDVALLAALPGLRRLHTQPLDHPEYEILVAEHASRGLEITGAIDADDSLQREFEEGWG